MNAIMESKKGILTIIGIIFFLNQVVSQTTIDLLVVYTSDAANNLITYGETKSIADELQDALLYTQTAFDNSGVNINLNLVYLAEVELVTSANDGETLQWLRTPDDGIIDIVHHWRDSSNADLVCLISTGGAVEGIGGWPQANTTEWEPDGFFLVNVANDMLENSDRTFAHELGHSLGGQHDWYDPIHIEMSDADDPGRSIWHHRGYMYYDDVADTGFYTIMAYGNLCYDLGGSCNALPYFSNPNITYGGEPTGVAEVVPSWNINPDCYSSTASVLTSGCPSDVVSIFNWMAPVVARYRSAQGPDTIPGNLSVISGSSHLIELNWDEEISNETGFRIYRSIDNGMNYHLYDSVSANTTSFTDTLNDVLFYNQDWIYRVQAQNSFGYSTYIDDTLDVVFEYSSIDEDFESGDLSLLSWLNNDENYPWEVKSRNDGNGMAIQASTLLDFMGWEAGDGPPVLEITLEVETGMLIFEFMADALMSFKVDGEFLPNSGLSISGEWDTVAIPVFAGEHTFSWEFFGGGNFWLDNIDFPISSIPAQYTLEYGKGEHGVISGVATQIIDEGNSGSAVEVIPDNGYEFEAWSDGDTSNPRIDTNVIVDISVTALYAEVVSPIAYTLSYQAGSNGRINGIINQIVQEGSDGSTVEAIPDSNFVFNAWSDGNINNPRTDTNVSSDIAATALFIENIELHLKENKIVSKVYPNPASGEIIIELTDSFEDDSYYYSIYGMKGSLLISKEISGKIVVIPIEMLKPAMYYLVLSNSNGLIQKITFKKL